MLSKQFGKRSVEAIIVGIYVGGTSLTRRPVRSLFGLKMKFGTNGWSIGTEQFKHKSKQASINRCSETGGNGGGISRHLGGSKSFVEHAMDLSKTLQRTPTAFDIFCKTHVNKEGKCVDSRAQAVYDAMLNMVETASQKLPDGSQPSPLDMDAMYFEASGGEKKKRVYGLGSHASSMYQESLCSGATSAPPPPSASTVPPEIVSEMEGMKKKMTDLEEQNQSLLQQNQKLMRQMRHEWKRMRMMIQSGPGQTSQPQEDEEDHDEDDDDDEDDYDL
ncbi:uncharacterized protein LOC120252326 [Dioscorea cayenensis subsp. rotundata]|uniref:Uncharacterized protein LOC120252326 n=1 Tax=Dioscorea cayennensis subsp. rotundata TaxID=55577 RepID=A0AB40ANG3_DIOCR|nr:uncharacterized protein LOC120252326 [Dioscorea cayenensis subsp. rotundata]